MTAGPDTLFPPGLDSDLYGSLGTDFLDDEFHATQHRRGEQAMLELQKLAQLPWYDFSIIWDGGTNYIGRNHRTAEALYSASALHTVWGSVRTYLNGLGIPGGRVLIQKNGATNDSMPLLNTLQGFPGLQLYSAGFGKRDQAAGGGPPDTNFIIEVPSSGSSFTLGAGTPMIDIMGTDGYENWVIDGVSLDANNKADVTVLAKGKGTANNGMIFRCNLRGGAVDCLRVGPGASDSTDIFLIGTAISHNGTGHGERALLAVLSGDMMAMYNNIAIPSGQANAVYVGANIWMFGTHAGGGGSSQSAVKIVTAGAMTSFIGMYMDNQSDTTHGGFWVVPGSNAGRTLNIMLCRFNPNAATPFVVLDGTSVGSARAIAFVNIKNNWSRGNSSPNFVPAIVKFVNGWGSREAVDITGNQFLNTLKVWDTDGTGSGRPWTWGNKISPSTDTIPLPAGIRGENFITGTMNGAGPYAVPHNCYATPEIVVPNATRNSLPAGRISAYADATNVYFLSSATESNLPVCAIVKVIGS